MDTCQVQELQQALPGEGVMVPPEEECRTSETGTEAAEVDKSCYHIEVLQSPYSTVQAKLLEEKVKTFLTEKKSTFGDFSITEFADEFLKQHVISISLCDSEIPGVEKKVIDLTSVHLSVHVYQLHTDGAGAEELDEENLCAAQHWLLPSADFEGMWDSLVYDEPIKNRLLNYASTTLLFSDKKVDSNIISWNRVVLLHGPPGTGKTSLCKALAHKLCIRHSHRYTHGQLVEINSHSLFSKWFSESGKLVMKMFQRIQALMDDPSALVCILIDEVESLSAARKSSMNGAEPSDAIRVVNALLTQLDQIKKFPNVLILTTSNITGAIDLAFVDRADIKQYIGPPSTRAIYSIYLSCMNELTKCHVIQPAVTLLDMKALEITQFIKSSSTTHSLTLYDIARKSQGLSGRTLRKIPFMAHALFLTGHPVSSEAYLAALSRTVDHQFKEREELAKDT